MKVVSVGELIYRFRHFNFTNDEHAKEPEQIICSSKLWCSDPTRFNDPFDCTPNLVMSDIPIEEQVRRTKGMLQRRGISEASFEGLKVLAAAADGKFNSPEMKAILPHGMQQVIHGSSVCCFNKTWQDPRMWAQYAADHQGYCLEFQFDENWPREAVPIPVVYTKKRPEIDLSIDTIADQKAAWQYVVDSVFTKSDHWAAEKEVRVFRNEIPAGNFVFPEDSLRALYLGMKISPENKVRMINAVSKRSKSIPIFCLKPHRTQYEFEAVREN